MADDLLQSPRPRAGLKGSIRGDLDETGGIGGLTAVGSFDTSDQQQQQAFDEDDDIGNDDMITDVSTSSGRQRLYSEEDEEIRMAKAMAMAINNNPNLTPSEARHQVLQQFNKQDIAPSPPNPKPPQMQPSILHPIATALACFKDDDNQQHHKPGSVDHNNSSGTNAKKAAPQQHPLQLNPFANLQESMKKTRELAQERFHEIVQGAHGKHDSKVEQSEPATPITITNRSVAVPVSTTSAASSAASFDIAHTPATAAQKEATAKKVAPPQPTPPVVPVQAPPSPVRTNSMQLPNLQNFTQSLVQTVDAETTRKLRKSPVGFSSMVWKRRSGLGKYHGKNSWERRKLVIRGNNYVAYYKIDEVGEVSLENSTSMTDSITSADLASVPSSPIDEDGKKPPSWLEQAAMNLANKANMNSFIAPAADKDTPRGAIDLAKERATIAASIGHSGSPTPFCLSIKVRGETRWKLCFDTHDMQMQWLAALTDLVVTCSVDLYNEKLLAKADPRSHGGHSESVVYAPSASKDGAKQLWEMSKYEVRSFLDKPREDEDINPGIPDEEVDEDDEASTIVQDREVDAMPSTASKTIGFTLDASSNADKNKEAVWMLREKDLYLAAAIVNSALLISHAGSTTPNKFWHIATFANLGLWFLLSKQDAFESKTPSKHDTREAPPSSTQARKAAKMATPEKNKAKTSSQVSPLSSPQDDKMTPAFEPRAGSTSIQVNEPRDSSVKNGHTFAKWRAQPGSILQVRSHGYKSTKKKVPSPGSIYDCVAVDIFESAARYADMAKRVVLPKVNFTNDDAPKTWHSPDVFVISLSLPTEAPASMFGPSSDDGEGYTIAMYYVMRQDTRDILRRVTADDYDGQEKKVDDIQKSKVNAVKLFEQWVRRAPNDPDFFARFKFVPRMMNVKEAGLPSWMASYNGKPVLIKRPGKTGFLHQHPELSAMEFDVSLHPFPYVAKQAFSYLYQNVFRNLVVVFGFVIESRDEDELPECLIGLAEVCYPDPKDCQNGADLFAGTSHKSNEDDGERAEAAK